MALVHRRKRKAPRLTANTTDAFIPDDIRTLYEVHNYRNAAQVLATGCAEEFADILQGCASFA
jgi:CRISPR-associated protein Csd2